MNRFIINSNPFPKHLERQQRCKSRPNRSHVDAELRVELSLGRAARIRSTSGPRIISNSANRRQKSDVALNRAQCYLENLGLQPQDSGFLALLVFTL